MALWVLDALICIDHEKFFLSHLQSRGFLRTCFMSISNVSYQDPRHSLDPLQRLCTLEAELTLLLRISHHYGKSGAQVIFSMGALEHIASCKAIKLQLKGGIRRVDPKFGRNSAVDVQQRMVITPILRLVLSLTSLVDTSEFFEVKNKVVREVIDFIKAHQALFDHVLREDVSHADELTMEQINLVVSILCKVWPYEESEEHGFVQGLFSMMNSLFVACDSGALTLSKATPSVEYQRNSELHTFRLCFSLSSYLYFLVTKKSLRLQVSNRGTDYHAPVGKQQPTLDLLPYLLNTVTSALKRAAEEKSLLISKIQDVNELSRQEVDEIINMCVRRDCILPSDNIQKRRYIAMLEMCQIAGYRDRLITLLLILAENVLNIILVHFQDSSLMNDSTPAMRTITYGNIEADPEEDLKELCADLIPILERLESLSEGKTGHNLKVFQRLVTSLKETTIHKLSL